MRRFAIALIAVALFPLNAFAWGPDGHRIVCRIAFLMLDDAEKQEVIRLTAAFQRPDGKPTKFFTDGCLFPDEARANGRKGMEGWTKYSRFDNQHFINLERTTDVVNEAECDNDCVLTGIASQAAALKNGADDQARAEALLFLGHFVGDIHQPLHVSFEDDRGGNNIEPIKGGVYKSGSLHAVWDSGILAVAIGGQGWLPFGEKLKDDITDAQRELWIAQPPLEWAQESYTISTSNSVDYCIPSPSECSEQPGGRTLTRAYQNLHRDDVETRLKTAGARLANEIKKALAD